MLLKNSKKELTLPGMWAIFKIEAIPVILKWTKLFVKFMSPAQKMKKNLLI